MNSQFERDVYTVQQGRVRLLVTVRDGPLTLETEGVMAPTEVAPGATTEIHLSAPKPRDFTLLRTGLRTGQC